MNKMDLKKQIDNLVDILSQDTSINEETRNSLVSLSAEVVADPTAANIMCLELAVKNLADVEKYLLALKTVDEYLNSPLQAPTEGS